MKMCKSFIDMVYVTCERYVTYVLTLCEMNM